MMDPELLDKLDFIARAMRRRGDVPFGGIQVILCGDFMQLPPIPPRRNQWKQQREEEEGGGRRNGCEGDGDEEEVVVAAATPRRSTYCFEGEAWKALELTTVVLRQKFRQHHDASFQRVLDDVRFGTLSMQTHELLMSRAVARTGGSAKSRRRHGLADETANAVTVAEGGNEKERYVRLCATNKEVEARNAKYFAALEPCGLGASAMMTSAPAQLQDTNAAAAAADSDKGRSARVCADDDDAADQSDTTRPLMQYRAYDTYDDEDGGPPSWVKFEDSTLPTELVLKVGTRVMLLQNISLRLGLVNGSVGEVVGFLHPLELVELVLRAPRERHCASARGQELLQRGGFSTVHDAFRCVDTAIGQSLFWSLRQRGMRQPAEVSYGAVYGNTHHQTLQRLVGLAGAAAAQSVHPLEMYLGGVTPQQLRRTRLPVVKLDLQPQHLSLRNTSSSSTDNRGVQLPRHVYAFVSPSSHQWYMGDQVVATRTQLPLRQAWAMTVHKAQGLTISHVEVSMHRFFSPGQAYVALSRGTRLENIRLLNFGDNSIRACPIAKSFYAALEEAGDVEV
ncbi:PIF1 helicase-like protein [Trypanosoma grayi]|uniref:PIF1 helicase-like protein n=1 Tax=Trypanosoma grayi TaxID=71804 RepID=UPI0004F42F33|nr:PIF1 helicase-like protein [Trypanosoma grayi]KEG05832.1 PIF1 helicase-like protein [Trypanosoma grayi]